VSEPGYTVAWTAAGRRALARLPEKVGTAVVEFLYGSYRRIVEVLAIEHRSDIYRPRQL
jgi:hypothetical protein